MVSIIVPCYKAAQVLPRCVESIQKQTYTDWELVLVNDGSPDETGEICDGYANDRIHVIHKPNGGVSSARNAGIDFAKGEWLTFVDVDDYLQPDYLQKLIEGKEADFSLCGFISSEGIDYTPAAQYAEGDNLNGQFVQQLVEDNYLLYSPWCKLFRKNIIDKHHHRFDHRIRLGEDTIFCYQYLLMCESIKIVASNMYFYEGTWGGGKKYMLTQKEVEYLDQTEICTLREINEFFGCRINLTERGYHVGMLRGLYSDFTDMDIYKMYTRSHGEIPLEQFYATRNLSYIFWGIAKLEALYREKKYVEGRKMMHDLHLFLTIPTDRLIGYPVKMKIFHRLLRNGSLVMLHILLLITTRIK